MEFPGGAACQVSGSGSSSHPLRRLYTALLSMTPLVGFIMASTELPRMPLESQSLPGDCKLHGRLENIFCIANARQMKQYWERTRYLQHGGTLLSQDPSLRYSASRVSSAPQPPSIALVASSFRSHCSFRPAGLTKTPETLQAY